MGSLSELQASFRVAMLGGDGPEIAMMIAGDGFGASELLQIYRNHFRVSLTEALQATFPVVCRLVHERFFAYAAAEYVAENPPREPRLFAYGASFADFLEGFPPCKELPYLGDVARLEWALNLALHADETPALDEASLAAVASKAVGRLAFGFNPSICYLASRWPVHSIWKANRSENGSAATVDLRTGPAWLEARRLDGEVGFRSLDPATFAFRAALQAGRALADVAVERLIADPSFDVGAALRALVTEGVLASVSIMPSNPNEET